jgi:hypothetical protein
METTEPSFQLYSGNFLDGAALSKASTQLRDGQRYPYVQHGALCLGAHPARKFNYVVLHECCFCQARVCSIALLRVVATVNTSPAFCNVPKRP